MITHVTTLPPTRFAGVYRVQLQWADGRGLTQTEEIAVSESRLQFEESYNSHQGHPCGFTVDPEDQGNSYLLVDDEYGSDWTDYLTVMDSVSTLDETRDEEQADEVFNGFWNDLTGRISRLKHAVLKVTRQGGNRVSFALETTQHE